MLSRGSRDRTLRITALHKHWARHRLAKNCDYYGLIVPQCVVCGQSELHGHYKKITFLFPTQVLLNQTPSEGWSLGL